MVRWMLVERCRPDWSYVERLIEDFNQRLDEDATFLTEKLEPELESSFRSKRIVHTTPRIGCLDTFSYVVVEKENI